MNYKNDVTARYLAMRVLQNESNSKIGMTYEKAITAKTTTTPAIDWWITKLRLKE